MIHIAYAVIALVAGLCFGSFMNVLVYRLPRGLNIATPPSSCPQCGYLIRWYSNIPLISYILQRGRCKGCGCKIPLMYPVVEAVTGILFLLVYLKYGATILTIKYLVFVFLLLAAAFTDFFTSLDKERFECGVIPDFYTVGGALIGFVFSFFATDITFTAALAGAGAGVFFLLIVGYVYTLVRGVEGIGMGDVILLGMIGAYLGAQSILVIITMSALVGAIAGIFVIKATKDKNYMIPFGPMISAAAIVYIFADSYILRFLGL